MECGPCLALPAPATPGQLRVRVEFKVHHRQLEQETKQETTIMIINELKEGTEVCKRLEELNIELMLSDHKLCNL